MVNCERDLIHREKDLRGSDYHHMNLIPHRRSHHTHTHTHTCELPESAHRTNTTHIKVLLQAVDLLLSVIWWKGDVQPGCTAMEGEAQGPSRANPEQQVHHPGRKGLALCCTG